METSIVPDPRLPVPFERISAHGYDDLNVEWINSQPSQQFPDIGAALARDYRENIVYTDIDSLPTVDVVCFGDRLPFDDNTFDGVICLAVLEHVPNPFVEPLKWPG